MAPKSKGKAKSKANADSSAQEESNEPLYAILLADSFETRTSPFHLTTPRCLIPLAGTPIIEYTLTWLFDSQVSRVHIYPGAHHQQVADYLKKSKWMTSDAFFQEVTIVENRATSVGDVMRDLDAKAFLKNDFIVVYGDLICNVPVSEALDAHLKRRSKDKSIIMTRIMHNSSSQTEETWPGSPVLAYSETQQLLAYEQSGNEGDLDFTEAAVASDVEITGNLMEAYDICTPELLAQWTSNFDFQRPGGFLHQVLKDEVQQLKVFLHILQDPGQYARRIQHFRAYNGMSRQVIQRLSAPYCPDMNIILPEQQYELHMSGNEFVYIDTQGTAIPKSCTIGSSTVIGAQVVLGESVRIYQSVVGSHSQVGANSVIEDSYLWGENKVGSGSTITRAVLGTGVQIGSNCVIEQGAMIGNNVRIDDGVTVKANSKLSLYKQLLGGDTTLHAAAKDPLIVGAHGQGALFEDHRSAALDEDDPEAKEILIEKANDLTYDEAYAQALTLKNTLPNVSNEPSGPGFQDSDADSATGLSTPPSPSHPSDGEFHHEATTSLLTSLRRKDHGANMQIELNSLRLASNASEHAVRRAVSLAFSTFFLENVQGPASINVKSLVDTSVSNNKILFSRIIFDKKTDAKTDQSDLLLGFQKGLLEPMQHQHDEGEHKLAASGDVAVAGNIFVHLITAFVSLDVLEAEGVEAWWESAQSQDGGEAFKAVREKARTVVEFLLESDDEDEDDEESEDDE